MKERSRFPSQRVRRLSASSFAQGTGDARQSEILECGRAPIGPRMDVVYVKLRFLPGLGESAVFATATRKPDYRPPQRKGYIHAAADRMRDARSLSSESISAKSTKPSASLRSAALRGVPRS